MYLPLHVRKEKHLLRQRRDTGGERVCAPNSKPTAFRKTLFRSLFPLVQALPLALQPYRTKKNQGNHYISMAEENSRPPALHTELLSLQTRVFRQRLRLHRSEEHSQQSVEGAAGRSPPGWPRGRSQRARHPAAKCQPGPFPLGPSVGHPA